MNKTALSLLIGMISSPLLAQNVVVFGDSLSDIGQTGWKHKASYYQNGKANDLYDELLAQKLGSTLKASTQGGTNYAYSGGVIVGANSSDFATQPNVAVQNQINQYLRQGAKPANLHILWAGGNDMAAILVKALQSQDKTATVIDEATKAAQASAQQWATLRQAGVETVVAPTVPNVVYTPSLFARFGHVFVDGLKKEAVAKGVPESIATRTADAFRQIFDQNLLALNQTKQSSLADVEKARLDVLKKSIETLYQKQPLLTLLLKREEATQIAIQKYQESAALASKATQLFNSLTTQAYNKVGGNIVRLNTDALFEDMLSRPEEYGISNTVGAVCQSTTGTTPCTPNIANPQNFLFTDGFHPNSIAHQVMADYIYTSLNSPKEMAVLARLTDQLAENNQRVAVTESNHNRFGLQPVHTVKSISVYEKQKGGYGVHLGFNTQFTPNWQFSSIFSYQEKDAAQGLTSAKAKAKGINATLRYDAEKWWLGSTLGVNSAEYALQRSVKLGQRWHHQTAETKSAVVFSSVFAGYEFNWDKHVLATIGEATYSQRNISAFGEQKAEPTQMQFKLAKANQFTTILGAEYRYQLETFQPYLSARFVKAWRKLNNHLQVGLNGSQYYVNLAPEDRQWLNVQAGLQWQPAQLPVQIYTQISQDIGRSNGLNKPQFNLGLNYQF